jgi:hypothetical protein
MLWFSLAIVIAFSALVGVALYFARSERRDKPKI